MKTNFYPSMILPAQQQRPAVPRPPVTQLHFGSKKSDKDEIVTRAMLQRTLNRRDLLAHLRETALYASLGGLALSPIGAKLLESGEHAEHAADHAELPPRHGFQQASFDGHQHHGHDHNSHRPAPNKPATSGGHQDVDLHGEVTVDNSFRLLRSEMAVDGIQKVGYGLVGAALAAALGLLSVAGRSTLDKLRQRGQAEKAGS